jgi:hypothetical protein
MGKRLRIMKLETNARIENMKSEIKIGSGATRVKK